MTFHLAHRSGFPQAFSWGRFFGRAFVLGCQRFRSEHHPQVVKKMTVEYPALFKKQSNAAEPSG